MNFFAQIPATNDEISVVSFAGLGGTATAIEMATGESPAIAINHCADYLDMHAANHPGTIHLKENVYQVDMDAVTRGNPVGLFCASPDCTHFSRARGGRPVSKSIRGLAWSVVIHCQQMSEAKRPRVIILENVKEFLTWEELEPWKKALRKLGYKLEFKVTRACDFGDPTIRERLLMIARRDGLPIIWPKPTHGSPTDPDVISGKKKPWRTAAEIIDWSLPCPSIFDTRAQIKEKYGLRAQRPLADNTMARIAKGIQKYVIEAEQPFFVTMGQHGGSNRSGDDPMHTICASRKDQNAIVVPKMMRVAAFMAQHNLGVVGRKVDAPLASLTRTCSQQMLVTTHLLHLKGTDRADQAITEPVPTICTSGGHIAEVRAFLIKYYGAGIGQTLHGPLGTVTTRDRFGLVIVKVGGEPYVIYDIGMRMLSPRELFRAQGFPDSYEIDIDCNGKHVTDQVKKGGCGNSVPPGWYAAHIKANYQPRVGEVRA